MSQVEIPKVVVHTVFGPDSGEIAVPKFVVHVILSPSDAGEEASARQGHVYGRQVRNVD